MTGKDRDEPSSRALDQAATFDGSGDPEVTVVAISRCSLPRSVPIARRREDDAFQRPR